MARKSTSVNLEEDHVEWMDRENKNRSEFINELIQAYRDGGGMIETAMNEKRRRELDTEIRALRNKLELKEEEREELDGDYTSDGKAVDAVLDKAEEQLSEHQLHENSSPIEFWADKAEMSKDEFLTEMWGRFDD